MIQIPTSYTISVVSLFCALYHISTGNETDAFNFFIILCIAGCFALANLIAPKETDKPAAEPPAEPNNPQTDHETQI